MTGPNRSDVADLAHDYPVMNKRDPAFRERTTIARTREELLDHSDVRAARRTWLCHGRLNGPPGREWAYAKREFLPGPPHER